MIRGHILIILLNIIQNTTVPKLTASSVPVRCSSASALPPAKIEKKMMTVFFFLFDETHFISTLLAVEAVYDEYYSSS